MNVKEKRIYIRFIKKNKQKKRILYFRCLCGYSKYIRESEKKKEKRKKKKKEKNKRKKNETKRKNKQTETKRKKKAVAEQTKRDVWYQVSWMNTYNLTAHNSRMRT